MSTFSMAAWSSRSLVRQKLIQDLKQRKEFEGEIWDKLGQWDSSSEVAFNMMKAATKIELLNELIQQIIKEESEDGED